jgi:hypothetical protein
MAEGDEPNPSFDGAVQVTVALEDPEVYVTDGAVGAVGAVGAPATALGVEDTGVLGSDVPIALVAVTRRRYAVAFVRPVSTHWVAVEAHAPYVVHVTAASLEYDTEYPVIVDPPLLGAVHDRVTCALPGTARSPVGVAGGVSCGDGVVVVVVDDTGAPALLSADVPLHTMAALDVVQVVTVSFVIRERAHPPPGTAPARPTAVAGVAPKSFVSYDITVGAVEATGESAVEATVVDLVVTEATAASTSEVTGTA